MDDHKLEKSDLLHFIPALLFFINISPYVFSGWEHKLSYANNVIIDAKNLVAIDYIFMPPKISFLTRPIIALWYVIASVVLIIRRGLNENYLC